MKVRVISGVVALVICIMVLLLAHTWVLDLAVASLCVGALYELYRAMGLVRYRLECCVSFGYAAFSCMIGMVTRNGVLGFLDQKFWLVLYVGLMLGLFLKFYSVYSYTVPFTFIGVTLGVTYSFRSLISIIWSFPKFGVFAVVMTLAGAWLADTGAYFCGTFFGRTKLSPHISPKKTVEGFIGGTVVTGLLLLIVALVYGKLINKDVDVSYLGVFIAGMCCSAVGLLGDLSASVIKRQAQIKDYGNIMPGHGGVMDRFDSVILVAPFMFWLFSNGWLIR